MTRSDSDRQALSVLVLDGEWENALSIVRSLGRQGYRIHVGSARKQAIAAYSRFCRQHFIYPDPLTDKQDFQQAILDQAGRCSYALIIPVTDVSICPIMEIRDSLERHAPVALASNKALAAAQSKSRTYLLARSLGVPLPLSITVKSLDEAVTASQHLRYPVVIKPDRSRVWSREGKGITLTTAYAHTRDELQECVSRLLESGPTLIQEYVEGEVTGVGLLAANGEILTAFQFRSLHEVPLSGGISSYRESETVDEELLGYCSRIMKALSWNGVAHVEFIQNRAEGRTHLMEINGRFWASLPLAVAAGADFPGNLAAMFLDGPKSVKPTGYRVGVRSRQLYWDQKWLREALSLHLKRRPTGTTAAPPDLRSITRDTIRVLAPSETTDTLDHRDPLPGIYDCMRILIETAREFKRLTVRASRMRFSPGPLKSQPITSFRRNANKRIKALIGRLVFGFGLNRLILSNAAAVVVFHRINDSDDGAALMACTPDMFSGYCRFFQRYFRTVPLGDILKELDSGAKAAPPLAVTFDDGYQDNFENAAPILRRMGIPATFFITTAFVDTQHIAWWDRKNGEHQAREVECGSVSMENETSTPWMTWEQVISLDHDGFEIGSHTQTHADLGRVGGESAWKEIFGSKADLEERIQKEVKSFAYPYGEERHITPENRILVKDAGYKCCCSGYGGVNQAAGNPFDLRRIAINSWYLSPFHFAGDIIVKILKERLLRLIK